VLTNRYTRQRHDDERAASDAGKTQLFRAFAAHANPLPQLFSPTIIDGAIRKIAASDR
jgi:hypothetical protein